MINILQYIYHFLYHSSKNKYSLISLFPLLSIIIGSIIIFFTISIMDGMENAIIKRMESFNFTYSGSLSKDPLVNSDFDIYIGNSKKYLIFKNDNYKIVNITSIDNFSQFTDKYIQDYLIASVAQPGIIIGQGLALSLDLKVGDKISLASPTDINIMTGYMPVDSLVSISGIFNYRIMDYDYNYAFISNALNLKVLPSEADKIFLKSKKDILLPNKDMLTYKFVNFKDENSTFFKALNTEKLIYSMFGYIVILIASASSISLMSLFIIRKKKQLSILKTLGFRNEMISKILIMNSLLVSLIGVSIGSLIYLVILSINSEYHFIQDMFFSTLPFEFSIRFSFVYFIQILLTSSLLMVLGSLYPIAKVLKINLANSLKD